MIVNLNDIPTGTVIQTGADGEQRAPIQNNVSVQVSPDGKTDAPKTDTTATTFESIAQKFPKYWERVKTLPPPACTGFDETDKKLKIRGLSTLGAVSGGGKTSFALNIAYNRTREYKPTIYITLEVSAALIFERLLCIASNDFRIKDQYTEQDGRNVQDLRGCNWDCITLIEYEDTKGGLGAFDVDDMKKAVLELQKKYNTKDVLIIIDSLNMLDMSKFGNDLNNAIKLQMRELSKFTQICNCNILQLAQMTKAAAKDTQNGKDDGDIVGKMYDFRDSGFIPYLSDCCFVILPDGNTPETDTATSCVKVCSAKNRKGAKRQEVAFVWDMEKYKFTEK